MLEVILLVLSLAVMARKPRRRRQFNLRKVKFSPSLALSTLGSVTALVANYFGAADGAYRIMSISATYSMEDHVGAEGPILVGVSHGDYTVTEIKEFIESGSSISVGDKIQSERANRLIRHIGTFSGISNAETLNDGRPIKTKLNWLIPIGKTLNVWYYNDSINALSTGTVMKANGSGWVKDN